MEKIEIGFKYKYKCINIYKEVYYTEYEVIGRYYKNSIGGTSYNSISDLLESNPIILQIARVDPFYKIADISLIAETKLIKTFIEDNKLKDEFKLFIIN